MKKNVRKIWQKLKKKMAKGRVGVGHSLPIPTELKHRQYTYRHLPTGRSRSDPYPRDLLGQTKFLKKPLI